MFSPTLYPPVSKARRFSPPAAASAGPQGLPLPPSLSPSALPKGRPLSPSLTSSPTLPVPPLAASAQTIAPVRPAEVQPSQAPAEPEAPLQASVMAAPPAPSGLHADSWPTMAARMALFSVAPEQVDPVEASVTGTIPEWVAGSVITNGGGDYSAMSHVFDGFACLSKLEVKGGRVFGRQRYLQSASYKSFKATGKLAKTEFVSMPPWKNWQEQFWYRLDGTIALLRNQPNFTDNASVTLTPLPNGLLLALSEVKNASYLVDADTLQTVQNRMLFEDEIYTLQTAHTKQLPDGRLVGFTTNTVIRGQSEVYVMDPVTFQRKVLAVIPHREAAAAMIHDFAVTDKYIILPEPCLFYYPPALIAGVMGGEVAGMLEWKPWLGSRVYVIPLNGKGQVLTYNAPPFFMTHTANAFESEDGQFLYLDFSCADDAQMVNDFFKNKLLRFPGTDIPKSWLRRLTIPLKTCPISGQAKQPLLISPQPVVNDEHMYGDMSDLPAINPTMQGKKYRYAYTVCARRPSNLYNSLAKLDLYRRRTEAVWHLPGCVAGEPVFVPAPNAAAEDEGVLLAQITLPNGHTALLVLDACTFEQLAIAEMPYSSGYRFHSTWVPA